MKITLTRHYQNMRGQTLTPREYDANDPDLGGLAGYLVENGYAYVSEKDAPKPAPIIEPLAVDLDETGELEDSEDLVIGVDLAEGEDFTAETVIEDIDLITPKVEPAVEPAAEEEPAPSKRNKK